MSPRGRTAGAGPGRVHELMHGRLQIREYTDKNGDNKTSSEAIILELEFIDRKHVDGNGNNANTSVKNSGGNGYTEMPNEDLPF